MLSPQLLQLLPMLMRMGGGQGQGGGGPSFMSGMQNGLGLLPMAMTKKDGGLDPMRLTTPGLLGAGK